MDPISILRLTLARGGKWNAHLEQAVRQGLLHLSPVTDGGLGMVETGEVCLYILVVSKFVTQ